MLLHRIKKFAFIFGVMTVLVIALSLPAFAEDIEFTVPEYPSQYLVNSSQYQSYSLIFRNNVGEYCYAIVTLQDSNNRFVANQYQVSPLAVEFSVGNDTTKNFLPCVYASPTPNGYVFGLTYRLILYFPDGSSNSNITSDTWYPFQFNWSGHPYGFCPLFYGRQQNAENLRNSCSLFDDFSFYVLSSNSNSIAGGPAFINNFNGYLPYCNAEYITFDSDGYVNGEAVCSIEDNIFINGTLVYSPNAPGVVTKIISDGIGNLVPEYDSNGNITGYTFNVTTETDLTPIIDYQPDGATVPDLNIDSNDDSFPEAEFDSDDLDDLGIMSGGTALTWFYARFDDLATGNVKVLALITSCLSLGFITLILNKRSI